MCIIDVIVVRQSKYRFTRLGGWVSTNNNCFAASLNQIDGSSLVWSSIDNNSQSYRVAEIYLWVFVFIHNWFPVHGFFLFKFPSG
mmetsp:Transcript_11687/g.33367  ORF Transcript_11687/g.33367 Transcript_11687/m.33367 type:complete len:85 (+) Transcript_11687:397-651(+)